ncbi:MAG: FAD-dependent oxidoreductase [Candidatus Pacebacteria bacterium]|nr:FAD-dependent oxidoreductase [Candidatus Paceibacterota bacterium]
MNTYDLLIIGGGPAGVAAGVYASRKQLKTLFVTESFEGQSAVSEGIENWIGTIKISGADLAKSLENHLKAYAADIVDIKIHCRVTSISKHSDYTDLAPLFSIKVTDSFSGEVTESVVKSILISTGSTRRKLEAKNADIYEHKGLTYCATCDGPVFSGQDVAVLGGGNAAFESAAQLAAYCKTVTIINRSETFRADPVTVEKVCAKENVKVIKGVKVDEIFGEKFVKGLIYSSSSIENGAPQTLAVGGIFVEIGLIPNTAFVKEVVELDSYGKILTDARTQRTKTAGIWAAGDCTDGLYHQNNIAAGDAVKALEDIYIAVSKR